jgi:hypothetical protein
VWPETCATQVGVCARLETEEGKATRHAHRSYYTGHSGQSALGPLRSGWYPCVASNNLPCGKASTLDREQPAQQLTPWDLAAFAALLYLDTSTASTQLGVALNS